jgi:hypothetical protein
MRSAEFNRRQTRGFPEQKITGQATDGIVELRCTGGAGETTTSARRRQVVGFDPTD